MNPRGPESRRLVVDCTLTLEVGVQYHPDGTVEITVVDADWRKLQVGLAYWQPTERRTNIGVDHDIRTHLERQLPREVELRHHRKKPR